MQENNWLFIMSHKTRAVETNAFLGLQNTKLEGSLPNGALVVADNVMIDSSGAVHRRPGGRPIYPKGVYSSYSSKDDSVCYLVSGDNLFLFTGSDMLLILEGVGSEVLWAEESAGLVFMKSLDRYVALRGGSVTNLNIPQVGNFSCTIGGGALPGGEIRIISQYEDVATGLLGPASNMMAVDVPVNSSLLITLEARKGYIAHVYAEFVGYTPFVYVGAAESFLVVTALPAAHEPVDEGFFETSGFPPLGSVMTFYNNRVCVASLDSAVSRVQFSLPGAYHIFDRIREDFEVPDVVTGMMQVGEKLLITGVRSVWEYSINGLARVSMYGTPPGNPIQLMPDGSVLIMTFRGICKYPEFKNISENVFSISAGMWCSLSLMQVEGESFLLISTEGETLAYNASFFI